jgi:hypothetical protein
VKRQPKLAIIFYLIFMIVSSSKKTTSFKIKVKIDVLGIKKNRLWPNNKYAQIPFDRWFKFEK